MWLPVPNSEGLLSLLRSQFGDLVQLMKNRHKVSTPQDVQKLFSQEFGKNRDYCFEVRRLRTFLKLGDSVCQVRKGDDPAGSGFSLFGKYILTNGHVVGTDAAHHQNIRVVFSFESLEGNHQPIPVKVVARDFIKKSALIPKFDWALLEAEAELPPPLLEDFGLVTDKGMLCIIGHPDGKVKKIDPCFTIPLEERTQKVMPFITKEYFETNINDRSINNKDIQTYDTCFFGGSSGSPVFDENFKVVSMHSGGFYTESKGVYPNPKEIVSKVMEYSHSLSVIVQQIIIQLVDNDEFPLRVMIDCIPSEQRDGLKKELLQSREDLREKIEALFSPIVHMETD
ncbi:hypothetical protein NHX12_010446 [Muraenolepis orangiensis]|uniref:Serine protease n=1 Tax=Muraenolepis orangiensis TaxID=630683 RepID=A0A9Q0IAG0_9TELE|nr:hypothetical protein NHX12_010446 [Muraenolepis orangiensis]